MASCGGREPWQRAAQRDRLWGDDGSRPSLHSDRRLHPGTSTPSAAALQTRTCPSQNLTCCSLETPASSPQTGPESSAPTLPEAATVVLPTAPFAVTWAAREPATQWGLRHPPRTCGQPLPHAALPHTAWPSQTPAAPEPSRAVARVRSHTLSTTGGPGPSETQLSLPAHCLLWLT